MMSVHFLSCLTVWVATLEVTDQAGLAYMHMQMVNDYVTGKSLRQLDRRLQ